MTKTEGRNRAVELIRKSTRSHSLPAGLIASMEQDVAAKNAWLEANKPVPGDRLALAENELELHWFTWNYLNENILFRPARNTTWRSYAVEAASNYFYQGLKRLKGLATRGDTKALESFATYTLQMVEELTRFSETKPDSLTPCARKQRYWPVLKSFHPHFDVDHKSLLERLKVGESHPLNIYKGKWNPKDEIGKIALEVWERLEYLRALPYPFGAANWNQAERHAHNLPEFGPQTWPEWFKLGKQYLLETHVTKGDVLRLNQLGPPRSAGFLPTRLVQ